MNLQHKIICVIGGTGFFGSHFVKFCLQHEVKKVIVFSRDEYKQFHFEKELHDERVQFILGDVRDQEALKEATRRVDIIVHAAAYKQIPILEKNPYECVQTNVIGTKNVIQAARKNYIPKVLLISSDKAVEPINAYGATKMLAEKLFIQANNELPVNFSVIRYGNVLASRGSVFEKIIHGEKIDEIQITDPEMTRFWFTVDRVNELVVKALDAMQGGEIFVPLIPSMKINELFDVYAPHAVRTVIGRRPGEKIHEILMTEHESKRSHGMDQLYVILPEIKIERDYSFYEKFPMGMGMRYQSDTNDQWITKEEMKELLNSI